MKVFDVLLGEVFILGMFIGYFFNFLYMMKIMDGVEVMWLKK